MAQSCDSQELNELPIHIKPKTFATIVISLFAGALSVAGAYLMLLDSQKRIERIEPAVVKIPVLEEKITTLDKNVQLLVDNLIYKQK